MNAPAERLMAAGLVDRSEDANYVRKFLASVRLIEGSIYPFAVHRGRALCEWYGNNLDGAMPDAHLSTPDCADVLRFLASVYSATPDDCFGHSQEDAACGFIEIMGWVARELHKEDDDSE